VVVLVCEATIDRCGRAFSGRWRASCVPSPARQTFATKPCAPHLPVESNAVGEGVNSESFSPSRCTWSCTAATPTLHRTIEGTTGVFWMGLALKEVRSSKGTLSAALVLEAVEAMPMMWS
jgi:hypothetical protein